MTWSVTSNHLHTCVHFHPKSRNLNTPNTLVILDSVPCDVIEWIITCISFYWHVQYIKCDGEINHRKMSFLMTALRVHIYGKIASLDREIFVKFLFIHLGVRNCLQKIDHNCLFVIYRERLHSSLRHGIMKQHHDHLVSNLTFYRLFIDSNSGALFFFYFFIFQFLLQLICVVLWCIT